MLDIVKAPSEVLSQTAKPIKHIDNEVLRLITQMKQTLLGTHDPEGVGLAAPQVGRSLQLFLAKPTSKSPFLVFINPKIISESKTMQELKRPKRANAPARFARLDARLAEASARRGKLEGCLSLVNIWGTVKRHKEITLEYQLITDNLELITKTKTFSGFLAIIIQHEVDHLHGVLFPKRVLEQNGKLYKSHKNKKGEDVFEEIEI